MGSIALFYCERCLKFQNVSLVKFRELAVEIPPVFA